MAESNEPEWDQPELISWEKAVELVDEWDALAQEEM